MPTVHSPGKGTAIDSLKAIQGSSRFYMTKNQGFYDNLKDNASEQIMRESNILTGYGQDNQVNSSGAIKSSKDSKRQAENTTQYLKSKDD